MWNHSSRTLATRRILALKMRFRFVLNFLAITALAVVTANSGSAQIPLQQFPGLQQESRLVTFQGGGLHYLDATVADRFYLGLNVVIAPFTNAPSQQWVIVQQSPGVYTIQQQSSGQFLDAHETDADNIDFMVVTRSRQTFGNGDNGQFWRIVEYGGGFVTIEQISTGRFLEPYIHASVGFQVVTRPQGGQLQEWRMNDVQN